MSQPHHPPAQIKETITSIIIAFAMAFVFRGFVIEAFVIPTGSMAPTLLLADGEPVAVLGTPGGDTIPSTLAQIVQHLVDRRVPLDQAIEAPRWHQSFLPDEGRYEVNAKPGNEVLTALTRMGHKLRRLPYRMGDANCIVLTNGSAFGYADSREPGTAVGASP